MIGKIILGILLALLLLLIAALLIPVKVRFSYDQGDMELSVRYGPVRLRLFPPPEKDQNAADKPPKKKKEKKAKKEKPEKPKKPRAKINMDQILYALEKLPPVLGRALRRTGRSIRISPLKVYVLVAGDDPADTALLYGRLEAAVAAGLPVLENVIGIRDPDIRLYLDFTERRMDLIADVGAALRPGSLVWIALRAGGSLLKWFFGFRKLASPPPPEEEKREQNTEEPSQTEHEAA